MKPDWKDAPIWANWLACDFDGMWFWYENEPEADLQAGEWYIEGDCVSARAVGWDKSLEKRPE